MPEPVTPRKAIEAKPVPPTQCDLEEAETGSPIPPSHEEKIDVAALLAPAQSDGELGRLAQYRVLKELGHGGMGMVLYAEDSQLKRIAALKIMLPKFARDPNARDRFLREARAAAKLQHDNIVTIFQVGDEQGIPFIAMEFLKGVPLDQYLIEKGELEIGQTIRIGREMAEGLQAAHAVGLVHRDIKPANVWLEAPKGRVKILDFGLARQADDDVHLTKSGAVVGTPTYMAPEQARGEAVDARTDLWSLGVVLYRLCTGKLPFIGPNTMAVLTSIAVDKPVQVRKLNPEVPPALEGLIHLLLSKDAAKRPPSAQDVVDALIDIEKPVAGAPQVVKEVVYVPMATQVENSVFDGIDDSDYQNPQVKNKAPASRERQRPEPSPRTKTPIAYAPGSPTKLYFAIGVFAFLALAIGGFFAFRGSPKEAPKVADAPLKEPPKFVKPIVPALKPVEVMTPDRRAAELLLPHVGSLTLRLADGTEKKVKPGDSLPTGLFVLLVIDMEKTGGVSDKLASAALFPLEGDLRFLRAIKDTTSRFGLAKDDVVRLAASPAAACLTTLQARFPLNLETINALKHLSKLTSLRCDAPNADDALLAELKELSGLTELELTYLGHGKTIGPAAFAGLASLPLKRILLSSFEISDSTAFRQLARIPGLESIWLYSSTTFGDDALFELAGCQKLRYLRIERTPKLTADGVARFEQALPKCQVKWDANANTATADPDRKAVELLHPHIDGLWVRFADGRRLQIKKSDAVPEEAFVVEEIKFTYDGSKMPADFRNGLLLPAILGLESLQTFDAGVNWFTLSDAELARMASAPFARQLRTLVAYFELSPASIGSLKQFPQLSQFGGVASKADDAVLELLKDLQCIKHIYLAGLGRSGRVSQKGYLSLAALPLSSMSLNNGQGLNQASIKCFTEMPGLASFSLLNEARDDLLTEIAKFPQLEYLYLGGGKSVTDAGLSQLIGMKKLRRLGVDKWSAMTESGANKLSDSMPRCAISMNGRTYGPKIPAPALLKAPFTQEQAEKARAEWAKYEEIPERKQLDLPKGVKLDLVLIPPGQFRMGTEGNTTNAVPHDVTITKPFYMAVTETTQEQYEAVIGKNPSAFKVNGRSKDHIDPNTDTSKFPVEEVSWFAAETFCKAIKAQLPTEAQWEYACTAGTTSLFHFGNSLNGREANSNGEEPYPVNTAKGPKLGRTNYVASYKPNGFGLFDMHGNVSEWCRDWYAEKTTELADKDPEMSTEPADGQRSHRGGSWYVPSEFCRAAKRERYAPNKYWIAIGFRVIVQP